MKGIGTIKYKNINLKQQSCVLITQAEDHSGME